MAIIVRTEAAPVRLREAVAALSAGEMLATTDATISVLRTTVSRVKQDHPEREFRTSAADLGPTVWRVA